MNRLTLLFLLVMFVFVGSCFASIYVDDDALNDPAPQDPLISDPNENGTADHPYDSIQEAVNVAGPGETIVIQEGIYIEDILIDQKDIYLTSSEPNQPVILNTLVQGTGSNSVISIVESIVSINGVTIAHGMADQGGGIYCAYSELILTQCIVKENEAVIAGGGVWAIDSTLDLEDCEISNNQTSDGLDGEDETGPPEDSVQAGTGGDTGDGGGVYANNCSLTVDSCCITKNSTGQAGSGGASLNNFGGNGGNSGSGAGLYCTGSVLTLTHSEIAYNLTGDAGNGGYNGILAAYDRAVVGTSGSGGALFCENSTLNIFEVTIDNNTTGKAEFGELPYISPGQTTPTSGCGGGIYTISCEANLHDITIINNKTGSANDTCTWGGMAGHGGGIFVSGSSLFEIEDVYISNNMTGEGGNGYIDCGGTGGFGGGLYIDNCNDVIIRRCDFEYNQTGMGGAAPYSGGHGGNGASVCCDSDTLCVETCNFNYNKCGDRGGGDLGQGGHGGALYVTSRDCQIADSRFYFNRTGAGELPGQGDEGLEGLNGSGGAICCGGLWWENNDVPKRLELIKCEFIENKTEYYGGILGHYDGFGGAINGDIVIAVNCLFDSNEAYEKGGAISADFCSISNCTFYRNIVPDNYWGGMQGTGGISAYSVDSKNSILWGNSTGEVISESTQISATEVAVDYSCIQGLTGGLGGTGNIDDNPLFADPNNGDFHLKSEYGRWSPDLNIWMYDDETSPCIDTGDPNDPNWIEELWPNGERVNMGCYGGTNEASLSASNAGLSCDYNRDDVINQIDFEILSRQWSGDVQYVIPHGNVTVDAQLSEWSEDVQWMELGEVYYGDPVDLSHAVFALKWNNEENKIYAAVIVKDDDHVLTDYISWDTSDQLEVYCQGDAEGDVSWWNGVWDVAQQYIVGINAQGDTRAAFGLGESIDPVAGLEAVGRVEGEYLIYELAVTPFDHYGQFTGAETVVTDMTPGQTVAFDIVVDSKHDDGFGMMSENMMPQKFSHAESFAVYTLDDSVDRPSCLELTADTDRNCIVDLRELADFCTQWLQ